MKSLRITSYVSLTALGIAGMTASALAQAANSSASNCTDGGANCPSASAMGGEIVVTAAVGNRTAQNSSISVSQISQQEITNFSPRSQAEVLRTIPGLNVQDTAGPGGNANIGVRGIPVSTGGSEYVALQEDGLPVTLFGDIQFGNNDYWLRFDQNVSRVEAVRGGSASTFASQAPGAVINYVSNTGEHDGGEIALSKGLSYRENRIDFDYGQHISDDVRFHIGGFVVDGDGPTHLGYNAEQGYQIKGNITKDFSDGNGYLRLNFKRLDDQEPTFTSMPSLATISGSHITGLAPFSGVDPRSYASTGIYNQSFQILNHAGQLQTVQMQGIHPVVTSLGGEFKRDLGSHITVVDKMRWSNISGSFSNQWTGEATAASVEGAGSLRYAAGPLAGQTYAGNFVSNSAQAYVSMNDLGSLANDLTFSGKFDAGSHGKINARAGWFHMRQTISEDWRINNETQTLDSNGNPVPLDLFSSAGAQMAASGLTGFNNQWGVGGRSYDVTYTDDAPYAQLEGDFGRLNLDASYRYDSVLATGTAYAPVQGANITATDALGSASLPTYNTASTPADVLDYRKGYGSWSFGALYHLTDTTNAFVRVSDGGRFNADRLLYGQGFNADGSLNSGGDHLAVNRVYQQEAGLKRNGRVLGGHYHAEVTAYRTEVKESNYDFTAPSRGQSPFIDTVYHSYGVEATANASVGHFHLDSYVVYTHVKDEIHTTNMVMAMPAWTFLVSPSYDIGKAAIGLSVDGQSSSFIAANYIMPGSTFANAFVTIRPVNNLELALNVNNLFNTLGYRANNGSLAVTGPAAGLAANQGIFDNSAVLGRTTTASIRYHF